MDEETSGNWRCAMRLSNQGQGQESAYHDSTWSPRDWMQCNLEGKSRVGRHCPSLWMQEGGWHYGPRRGMRNEGRVWRSRNSANFWGVISGGYVEVEKRTHYNDHGSKFKVVCSAACPLLSNLANRSIVCSIHTDATLISIHLRSVSFT